MHIWLDTTHIQTIQKAIRFGLLTGITTNPTLIAQTKRELEDVLKELLRDQEGPIAVQVGAQETAEMVQQGQSLYFQSNRFIIKIPVTENGLEAIHLLARQGIPTMATAIFQPRQALLAALVGAKYVAPYLGRLETQGENPWDMLQTTMNLFQVYNLKTKILAASLPTVEHVLKCAEKGIYGVTLKKEIFHQLLESDSSTLKCMEQFSIDWKTIPHSLVAY